MIIERNDMSLLLRAKNKAYQNSFKTAFRNEDGAIDLASIMVGIIVIGLIGGVIAATVFAVIPWAQDNAAKQQLDSVASAQSARAGMNGGNYSTNLDGLLDTSAAKVKIVSNESTCFVAFKKSDSGQYFYNTSANSSPKKIATPWPATAPSGYPAGCTWPTSGLAAVGTQYTNLATNPSFDKLSADGVTPLGANITVGQATLKQATDSSAEYGPNVARYEVLTTNNVGISMSDKTVVVGQGYTVYLRVKSSRTMSVYVRLNGAADTQRVQLVAGQWTDVYGYFPSAVANNPYTGLLLDSASGHQPGDIIDVDAHMVVPGKYTGKYFDGNSEGASWNGAAQNSTSTIFIE